MSLSDSQTQNGKRSRETCEVYDSVFGFLMDFADKAENMFPQPMSRAVMDDDTANRGHVNEEEEPLENVGDGNAGEIFDKLPVRDKEELLKDVFGKIVKNMLNKVPEDGKEAFLVRCFKGLFPKLPCESQRVIEIKVKDALSQSQEAIATPSAPELPSAFENQFPADALQPVGFSVKYPPPIGDPEREEEPWDLRGLDSETIAPQPGAEPLFMTIQ
ncbi:hypothetical protein NL676_004766 [Syzygium grande]|nr:hypothetical protein NL676_004766 [Syzygium grande]